MCPNNEPWPNRSIYLRVFYETVSLRDFTKFTEKNFSDGVCFRELASLGQKYFFKRGIVQFKTNKWLQGRLSISSYEINQGSTRNFWGLYSYEKTVRVEPYVKLISDDFFNPFNASVPFLYPLKTSENQRFSGNI